MKKNTIKAFTLVEMLIVIVIIGILIASLMPRMQTAQGRARDVARKNDLSQIQTAIITSQSDQKHWPQLNSGAKTGLPIKSLETELLQAGMSSIPEDPNGSNVNFGLGDNIANQAAGQGTGQGQYIYVVSKRNGVPDGGFALMAKTEVEGSSNWVVCQNSGHKTGLSGGYITNTTDLKDVKLCKTITKTNTSNGNGCETNKDDCTFEDSAELRYILLY